MKVDSDLRRRIAKEAATLLYFGSEKEYKQAKIKAAKTIGAKFLPTNLEVAMELDKIAEENEGTNRKERLIQMRRGALKIMRTLKEYSPILIGSVWRGTVRRGSDIDITVYHDMPDEILNSIKTIAKISRTEWTAVTKKGKTNASLHIHFETPSKQPAEIVVRSSDEVGHRIKCEVFGDELKGLNIQELERVLKENPAQKFIPT